MTEKQENLFQSLSRMIDGGTDPGDRQEELWHRYGETVAVLVMDTSGFSRSCSSHGVVHFLTRLMQLRRLCQPVFLAHGCKRLRFEADNAFAAFSSADEAIHAALATHAAIAGEKLMLSDSERMRVSIGIGYGDMLYSETLEGYFGEEMNYASKLGEDLAGGDETYITGNTYRHAESTTVAGFQPASTRISGVDIVHYRHRYAPQP